MNIDIEPLNATNWGQIVALKRLVISLTVNAVVIGLIVLRILKVYLEVRPPSENRDLALFHLLARSANNSKNKAEPSMRHNLELVYLRHHHMHDASSNSLVIKCSVFKCQWPNC